MPIYWGDLHGHSNLSDGRSPAKDYYEYGRNESKLDFCALTDHVDNVPSSRLGLMPDRNWDKLRDLAKQFYEPQKFVTFLAVERAIPSWDGQSPGSMCVYYRTDEGPSLKPKHPARDWLRRGAIDPDAEMNQIWRAIKGFGHLTAIHHSGSARQGYTWTKAPTKYHFDLVEIYSKWGSSEALGAPFPIWDGVGRGSRPGGTVVDALDAGFRPGFIAGSDTHFGMPGSNVWENDWGNAARYERSGLTAVMAEELTREAIFEALKKRRCYATTGERIQLTFEINNHPMGSLVAEPTHLRVRVQAVGTQMIKRAEVFKNGDIAHHRTCGREELDMCFDEPVPAEPAWYYVRVTQVAENTAWSSPIWVLPHSHQSP